MQIKLIQSIRANGKQHRPPSVVDTKAIGISDAEVDVLVRSGVAVIVADAKAAKTDDERQAREAAEAEAAAAQAEATAKAEAEPDPEPAPTAKPAKKR
jgi:hypothetical protein